MECRLYVPLFAGCVDGGGESLYYVKTVITKGMQCSPPVGIAHLNYMYTLATRDAPIMLE